MTLNDPTALVQLITHGHMEVGARQREDDRMTVEVVSVLSLTWMTSGKSPSRSVSGPSSASSAKFYNPTSSVNCKKSAESRPTDNLCELTSLSTHNLTISGSV